MAINAAYRFEKGSIDKALYKATENADIARIREALAQNANPNAYDYMGRQALYVAVAGQNLEIVQILAPVTAPDHKDEDGCTPLAEAIAQLQIEEGGENDAEGVRNRLRAIIQTLRNSGCNYNDARRMVQEARHFGPPD